jgi:hypothetical protein
MSTTTVVTLRTDSVRRPGPRAEKDATAGAGLNSLMSSVGRMTAVGFLNQRQNENRSHFSQAGRRPLLDMENHFVTHLVEMM